MANDTHKHSAESRPESAGDYPNRRGFLKCMAWAGTGLVWTAGGGVLSSRAFGPADDWAGLARGLLVRPDQRQPHRVRRTPIKTSLGTLQEAVAKINVLASARLPDPHRRPHPPATPEEFDTVAEILKGVKAGQIFYVPGEHDVIGDGAGIPQAFGQGTKGEGWYSFDHQGVHFIGLVNVASQGRTGLGRPRQRAARLAQRRRGGAGQQHADRGVRPRPALGGLPPVGLGHRRTASRRCLPQAVRLGHRPERPHPPDPAEGRREHDLPHRPSTGFPQPAPGAGPPPGPMNVPAEALALGPRRARRDVCARRGPAGNRRRQARIGGPSIGARPDCRNKPPGRWTNGYDLWTVRRPRRRRKSDDERRPAPWRGLAKRPGADARCSATSRRSDESDAPRWGRQRRAP